MSRFLFVTFGSLGDVNPYIAIAQELIRQGHTATIATAEEYRETIKQVGISFAPVRPSITELGGAEIVFTQAFDPRYGLRYFTRKLLKHVEPTYDDLLSLAHDADVLISHPLTFALPLVAEKTGKPWVSSVLAPTSLMSGQLPPVLAALPWLRHLRCLGTPVYRWAFDKIVRPELAYWERDLPPFRAKLGLPPRKELALLEGQFSPKLNLAIFDDILAKPAPDWPENTQCCGSAHPLLNQEEQQIPTALREFLDSGQPPIIFALGSAVVWLADNFWNDALDAIQLIGRRAIFITGNRENTLSARSLPPSVFHIASISYEHIFPYAAAIVHQGGASTLAQAMRAGRPSLIVPLAFDQPDNARLAKELGIAITLPFTHVTKARLVTALRALLANQKIPKAVEHYAAIIKGKQPGAERAAQILIAYAQKQN